MTNVAKIMQAADGLPAPEMAAVVHFYVPAVELSSHSKPRIARVVARGGFKDLGRVIDALTQAATEYAISPRGILEGVAADFGWSMREGEVSQKRDDRSFRAWIEDDQIVVTVYRRGALDWQVRLRGVKLRGAPPVVVRAVLGQALTESWS